MTFWVSHGARCICLQFGDQGLVALRAPMATLVMMPLTKSGLTLDSIRAPDRVRKETVGILPGPRPNSLALLKARACVRDRRWA